MDSLRRWIKAHPRIKIILKLLRNSTSPFLSLGNLKGLLSYPEFISDYVCFRRMGGQASFLSIYPILSEKTEIHSIDPHYFYQAVWAMSLIAKSKATEHYDVGSQAIFVGMLTTITKVKFIDIRPLGVSLDSFSEEKGTILNLPMLDKTVMSLSCLNVAEHIGLGRYGDPIDPNGTVKAVKELERVLAPEGNLYFSLPVGKPRIEFNAHRVHSVSQVLSSFEDLRLVQFSIVTDDGVFHQDVPTEGWDNQNYACGMFWFKESITQ